MKHLLGATLLRRLGEALGLVGAAPAVALGAGKRQRLPRGVALASAVLVGCGHMAAWAGNVCDTQASLTNPQASAVQAPGIGGTGMLAARPGIGGTGMLAARPGIGGTGIDKGGLGGTGIVGVITGFASICVGGVEVHYSDDTPMSENGQPSRASALAVGQVVVVNAAGEGAEVQARQVALLHVAIGPLQSVNPASGEFALLGQRALAATPAQLAGLAPQQWVQVSGLRNAMGVIEATHVQAVPPQPQAQVLGVLVQNETQSKDTLTVAGTPVVMPAKLAQQLKLNTEVMLQGQWTGDHLAVQSVTAEPTRGALGRPQRVVLEGYVRQLQGSRLDVDHRELTLSAQTQINVAATPAGTSGLSVNQRVRVIGRVDAQQRIQVERVESVRHASHTAASALPAQPQTKEEPKPKMDESEKAAEPAHDTPQDRSHEDAAAAPAKTSPPQTESTSSSRASEASGTESRQSSASKSTGGAGASAASGAGNSASGNSGTSGHSGESKGSSHSSDSGKSGSSGKSASAGKSGGEHGKGK